MKKLTEELYYIEKSELDNKEYDASYILFDLKQKYSKENEALFLCFDNDVNKNIKIIKKLFKLRNKIFESIINKKKVRYIIDFSKDIEENEEYKNIIIEALRIIEIEKEEDRINYIYDYECDLLDRKWNKYNPCKFCDNKCSSQRAGKAWHKENGCCWDFDYSKVPWKFTENERICAYLDKNGCKTKNLSCKIFTCNYLIKNSDFKIIKEDLFLIECFFNAKRKMVAGHNFFVSKEELLNKLYEINMMPFPIYWFFNEYRINKK